MVDRADEKGQKMEHPTLPPREDQLLHHVTSAMSMVRRLPEFAHDGRADIPAVMRVACLESFFMNVRLIAEFLTKKPRRRDFGASSVVACWSTEETEAAERLAHWWNVASKHVAHFSLERIAEEPQVIEYEDTTLEGLLRVVADCEAEWKRFELAAGIYLP